MQKRMLSTKKQLFEYYNNKSIVEYIKSKQNDIYIPIGLGNHKQIGWNIGKLYVIKPETITFNKVENSIYFNIGWYADKELLYLLKYLFLPFNNKYGYNLKYHMEKENTNLILENNFPNQTNEFFKIVDDFFKNFNINIKKIGIWREILD